MDCSLPRSFIHGIFQARILEWVAISFSEDLPDPGVEPGPPAFAESKQTFLSNVFVSISGKGEYVHTGNLKKCGPGSSDIQAHHGDIIDAVSDNYNKVSHRNLLVS